jgi:hypothetical protein
LQESIKKTQEAIKYIEDTANYVNAVKEELPQPIRELIDNGELIQWKKHPTIFFVNGIDKARIDWKKGKLVHRYIRHVKDPEQYKKFAELFNNLKQNLN